MKQILSVLTLASLLLFQACKKSDDTPQDPPKQVPKVTTLPVTNIAGNTANGNGTVTDIGSDQITRRGVAWATVPNKRFDECYQAEWPGTSPLPGDFYATMTYLLPHTTYYVKTYAANKYGFGYGAEVSFTTP